jgi:hypothetical protein
MVLFCGQASTLLHFLHLCILVHERPWLMLLLLPPLLFVLLLLRLLLLLLLGAAACQRWTPQRIKQLLYASGSEG